MVLHSKIRAAPVASERRGETARTYDYGLEFKKRAEKSKNNTTLLLYFVQNTQKIWQKYEKCRFFEKFFLTISESYCII